MPTKFHPNTNNLRTPPKPRESLIPVGVRFLLGLICVEQNLLLGQHPSRYLNQPAIQLSLPKPEHVGTFLATLQPLVERFQPLNALVRRETGVIRQGSH